MYAGSSADHKYGCFTCDSKYGGLTCYYNYDGLTGGNIKWYFDRLP